MRTFTTLAAISVFALAAYGQESRGANSAKANSDAMNFDASHLSDEQCYKANYVDERTMAWDGSGNRSSDTAVLVGITQTPADTVADAARAKTPVWIFDMRENARTYQTERAMRTKRDDERRSGYSSTEQAIAANMGLLPWDIDRKQLRKWAQEVEGLAPSQ